MSPQKAASFILQIVAKYKKGAGEFEFCLAYISDALCALASHRRATAIDVAQHHGVSLVTLGGECARCGCVVSRDCEPSVTHMP